MARAALFALLFAAACGIPLAGAAEPPRKTEGEPKPVPPPAAKEGDPKPLPPPPAKEGEAGERLQAWADRILYHSDTGKFIFTGKVLVLKGELRVDCTEMEGAADPKTRDFVKIIAKGDVALSTVDTIKVGAGGERPSTTSDAPDTWRATCTNADYDLRAGKIIMTSAQGKPRPLLRRSQGSGEADTIIFFPQKGEYELIGNPIIRGEIPTGPAKPPKRTAAPKPKGQEEPKGKDEPPKAKDGGPPSAAKQP